MYFLIHSGEDGINIEALTQEEVLKRITPNEDGETYYGVDVEILKNIPSIDKGYFVTNKEDSILIIKGEIIVPRAVNMVTKYTLK